MSNFSYNFLELYTFPKLVRAIQCTRWSVAPTTSTKHIFICFVSFSIIINHVSIALSVHNNTIYHTGIRKTRFAHSDGNSRVYKGSGTSKSPLCNYISARDNQARASVYCARPCFFFAVKTNIVVPCRTTTVQINVGVVGVRSRGRVDDTHVGLL